MSYYLDANNTDGTDLSKIDRVYEDGTRVPLSQPELQFTDWDKLINAMLACPPYLRATTDTKDRNAAWLVTASVAIKPETAAQLMRLKAFWGRVITGLAEPLATQELEQLNAICTKYHAKFAFNPDGGLHLN